MKEIIIHIDENGDCSMEGKNFVGPECMTFISEIQECIGDSHTNTTKPEFRQRQQSRGKNRDSCSR